MKNYGLASIYEFLEDLVVYRNLSPVDPRLPPFIEIRKRLGLSSRITPRKTDADYARVIVALLKEARSIEAPGTSIKRLVYVGDTRLNDGTAFANICGAGRWIGVAFIGAEREDPAHVEIIEQNGETLYLANRWVAVADFDRFCRRREFHIDEATAVIVDLDKTALGARGRNDHVIDRVRVEAVRRTVIDLLGDHFDPIGFQTAYDRLNQPEFHSFTSDNQDYLAYICLILGSGLYELKGLIQDVRAGHIDSFQQVIAEVDERAEELPLGLRGIHHEIFSYVRRGDPTPFKAFRYNEYEMTIDRMGRLGDNASVDEVLQEEIVLTQEVRDIALRWRDQGALLFGLSDKPDEASIPSAHLAPRVYQAIHRVETHAIGG